MVDWGPIETVYLASMVLAAVIVFSRVAALLPSLGSLGGKYAAGLLGGFEGLVVVYGAHASGFASAPSLYSFAYGLVWFPAVGNVYFANVVEAVGLTAFAMWRGAGAVWVALFLLPVWVLFHDGLYFLVTDLLAGHTPYVYAAMLETYPAAYFPQFLVDISQAVCVPFVLLRLFARGSGWRYALAAPLLAVAVVTCVVGLYPYPDLPYMVLYSALVWLVLTMLEPARDWGRWGWA